MQITVCKFVHVKNSAPVRIRHWTYLEFLNSNLRNYLFTVKKRVNLDIERYDTIIVHFTRNNYEKRSKLVCNFGNGRSDVRRYKLWAAG